MSSHSLVSRTMRGAMLACITSLILPVGARGQTAAPQSAQSAQSVPSVQSAQSSQSAQAAQSAQSGKEDQVPVDLYREPSPKSIDQPDCGQLVTRDSEACELLIDGTEGWVELGFMVNPSGQPTEVTVIRSSGIKAFEAMAVKSIEHSTFNPGTLDGKAVESGYEMKYQFVDPSLFPGAGPDFARAYNKVRQAIAAGDRAAADAALKKLRITNFYEDAHYGLATYLYAEKWGNESDQLAGLQRAIAYEQRPRLLPKTLFEKLLFTRLKLEVDLHQYAEALETAQTLQKNGLDKLGAAQIASVIGMLQKLRSDGGAYEVSGSMPDGSWHLHLFKSHFQAMVSEGYISQVKLRCPTRYLSFDFDPKLQYTVSGKYGTCSIELDGAPGTKFKLVQF